MTEHPTYADYLPVEARTIPALCPGGCKRTLLPKRILDLDGQNYPERFMCYDDKVRLDSVVIEQQRLANVAAAKAEREAYEATTEYAQSVALKELGRIRWEHESAGFMFNGQRIALPEETQARIGNAIQGAEMKLAVNPEANTTVDWQARPGVFVALDLQALKLLGGAAYDHVQACFAHAKTLTDAILAADTPEAVRAIDLTQGWPE